jgi:hypothetical protein
MASSFLRASSVNRAQKGLCNGTFPERLKSNASRVPSSAVSSSAGLAAVIALPSIEPLVEFGVEVDAAQGCGLQTAGKVEHVIGVLNVTELASDVAVEGDICKPMQSGEAARRGWVEGLFGGGVLALMRVASRLGEGRWSESPESGFCDLRWRKLYENGRMDRGWEKGTAKRPSKGKKASQGAEGAETRNTTLYKSYTKVAYTR